MSSGRSRSVRSFLDEVLSEDEKIIRRLRIHKRVLNRAVLAIAPDCGREYQRTVAVNSGYDSIDGYNWGEADVDNYIQAYDCRPPPIFIPLITIAELVILLTNLPEMILPDVPIIDGHQTN
ncbi:unnamed protein product [Schistosoma margrebowiei]|uniref:Uncharacterized protein n=1 Tax=Schistosoma margrebowiei TaxID=48269 RepID=A0A183NCC8_9TREM|nr:unnamed protein product [Schistosoma margrebowiei]